MFFLSITFRAKKILSIWASFYTGCVAVNNWFLVKKIEKNSEKPLSRKG